MKQNSSQVSRRCFLKWSMASAAICASGLHAVEAVAAETAGSFSDKPAERLSGGHWQNVTCWVGCSGGCINRAYVKDGVVIRQKTDDRFKDTMENPQYRGCMKGRTTRRLIYSPERLKYPMKRKHWEPGGGRKELRGRDEWVRISWDEALDIIAKETTRIKETYGNRSILNLKSSTEVPSLLAYGGHNNIWGQQSAGACTLVANVCKGDWSDGANDSSDRLVVMKYAKNILLWGQNPAWSKAGNVHAYTYELAKQNGAKIKLVDPWFSPGNFPFADEWVPVRPSTDVALLLAIGYELIKNNWVDYEFLNKCTIGFDAEHMPKGADPRDNFKDYLLGTYDGMPKTPEWASEICGTPVKTIKELAKYMGTTKPLTIKASAAAARTYNGDDFVHAFYVVGWMTGNVGKPGAEVTIEMNGSNRMFGGPKIVDAGKSGIKFPKNKVCAPPRADELGQAKYEPGKYYGIALGEQWRAILEGRHKHFREGILPIDIRMLVKIGDGARIGQVVDINKGIEALRKVDFVVAADFFLNADAMYADIVLPAATAWERDGYVLVGESSKTKTAKETINSMDQIVQPAFEIRDEKWVEQELLKRWGINPKTVYPVPEKEFVFRQLKNSKHLTPEGKEMPFLTITQADLDELGYTGYKPQQGIVPYKEFKKEGVYTYKRHWDDAYCYIGYADFAKDPIKNPVPTESGKFEIYCKRRVTAYAEFGLTKGNAIPTYVPPQDGYEATFSDWKAKKKGQYPFQIYSIHPLHHVHSNYANEPSLRELLNDVIYMNPIDAKAYGIKHGDTAVLTSMAGKIMRRVRVIPTIMPGVLLTTEGPWPSIDEKTGIDIGGNPNTLSRTVLCGEGQEPWNTLVCGIEKWNGTPLPPDYRTPQRIIAFKQA
ncbi:MAG: molybdopterin-dependent oxidoreductase [Deferribacterales bacterium]